MSCRNGFRLSFLWRGGFPFVVLVVVAFRLVREAAQSAGLFVVGLAWLAVRVKRRAGKPDAVLVRRRLIAA